MAYLKYFQSVLLEFDDNSPDKFYLICFFCDILRPLIKVQIENDSQKSYNWEHLIQKVIKVEVKTSLWSFSILWKID